MSNQRNNSSPALVPNSSGFQDFFPFILALCVFSLDVLLPSTVLIPIAYFVILAMGVRFRRAGLVSWLAALCSALTLAGAVPISQPQPLEVWLDRGLIVATIWGFAFFVRYRRRVDAALAESERRFRNMADSAPVMVWMAGPDRSYNYFNQAWMDFTGRPLAQEIGNGWLSAVHPDDEDALTRGYAGAFNRRDKFTLEYRLRRADGQFRWILDIGSPRFSERGEFLGYIGSCVDIHERKEEELSKVLLGAIVESSDDAIISKSLEGRITSWNKGAERIYGYTADEMIGRPVDILIPAEKRSEEPRILESIRRGQRIEHFDTTRVTKAGKIIDVSLTVSPVRDRRGVIVGASKIARDVTERKRAQEQLAQEKAKLERVNLELDRFVYIASHDLRAPLRAISSFATFIREDYEAALDDKGRDFLKEITRGALKMSKLIDDLLILSRVSRINTAKELVAANALVVAALDRLSVEIQQTRARVDVQPDMPLLLCDRFKMTEVFVNLIGNAIKFSRNAGPHPEVTVRCKESPQGLEFTVSDRGIGIEPDYHQQIFEMFTRLHSDKEYEGTGLGLYIVKRIVEEANGRIWVESRNGQGSQFHFMLPACESIKQPAAGHQSMDGKLEERYV